MFKKQFFSIVFWKSLVYFLGILSLLIITPHLTSRPTIFGVYAFCSSILIFFSYADLGFIAAARKYAAEYVAKKQFKAEIAVTSFSCLVFLIFCLPLSFTILYFSYHPGCLIKDITEDEINVASGLLRILAVSFPIIILQRVIQIIYSVRFADQYVFKLEIVNIAVRLVSIYYFFSNDNYKIVEYFLFYNVLNLINVITLAYISYRKFNYDILFFLKSFRYRKSIYNKISSLAYNSLFVSVAWLLFFEIDLVLITYLAGAAATAQYAIAFNIANILRNVMGTLYYPLTVKFNHLFVVGKDQLKSFFFIIIKLGSYMLIPGIVILMLFSKALILSWVGHEFEHSVQITQLLVISYLFYPLSTPTGALLTTTLQMRLLYFNSIIYLLIQYLGLWLLYKYCDPGMLLAFLKVICAGTGCMLFINWLVNYLNMTMVGFLRNILTLPVTVSILFSILYFFLSPNLHATQDLLSLFSTVGIMTISYSLIIGLLLLLDKSFRTDILKIIKFG